MGGITTSGYPYVTPDDHPQVYPAASQQLAESIQTGLADLVQFPSFPGFGDWQIVEAHTAHRAGWVFIALAIVKNTGSAPAAGEQIATIPAGHRPHTSLSAIWPVAFSGSTGKSLLILATGEIMLNWSGPLPGLGETLYTSFSYPAEG